MSHGALATTWFGFHSLASLFIRQNRVRVSVICSATISPSTKPEPLRANDSGSLGASWKAPSAAREGAADWVMDYFTIRSMSKPGSSHTSMMNRPLPNPTALLGMTAIRNGSGFTMICGAVA
jgi:hypothetical protein